MNQNDICQFLHSLYSGTPVSSIASECRKKHNLDNNKTFVYGDSGLASLYEVFNELNPQPGHVFYDLGSGGGRVVLHAALSFPFAKCVGIEYLDDLANASQKVLTSFKKKLPKLKGSNTKKLGKVEFLNGDLFNADVSDGNVIYVASTCFEEEIMDRLARMLEKQLAPGSKVITGTKRLPSDQFKITKEQLYPMDWGTVTVFVHEKV